MLVVAVVSLASRAGAQAQPRCVPTAGVVCPAATAVTSQDTVRATDTVAMPDVSAGVRINPNSNRSTPGNLSTPVARFSAVNAPVWFGAQGQSVQVGNDLVAHNRVELQNGLLNNSPSAGQTPVHIYDDLVVGGGGAEPGNVVVSGALQAGNPGARSTVFGHVDMEDADLTVTGGNLNVVGSNTEITAQKIGNFYSPTASPRLTVGWTAWQTNPSRAQCAAGDILLSCVAHVDSSNTPQGQEGITTSSYMQGRDCIVNARASTAPASGRQYVVEAKAVCFSSD